jgi:hypothetical protein
MAKEVEGTKIIDASYGCEHAWTCECLKSFLMPFSRRDCVGALNKKH